MTIDWILYARAFEYRRLVVSFLQRPRCYGLAVMNFGIRYPIIDIWRMPLSYVRVIHITAIALTQLAFYTQRNEGKGRMKHKVTVDELKDYFGVLVESIHIIEMARKISLDGHGYELEVVETDVGGTIKLTSPDKTENMTYWHVDDLRTDPVFDRVTEMHNQNVSG